MPHIAGKPMLSPARLMGSVIKERCSIWSSQSQRTLNSIGGKDLEQVVLVPAATAASHRNALAILLLLQER
jgi:hypothetical protein